MAITAAPGWAVNSKGTGVYQIGTPDPTLSTAASATPTASSGTITRTSSATPSSTPSPAPQPTVPTPQPTPQVLNTTQPSQTPTSTGAAASTAAAATPPPSTNLQPGAKGPDVQALQSYLVQMGYLTPQQVATGSGTYGPQTTAAVAKMQQDLGIQAGQNAGDYGPQTQKALTAKYQAAHGAMTGQSPDTQGAASSALSPYLQNTQSSNPVFNSMAAAMQPIMDSLSQVMANINNPALTAVSLQQEYNTLSQQSNLPTLQSQMMNMQNVMNGTSDDIRAEVTSAGGFATESQVAALTASRNNVILKQYNAVATQYQAAQTNVQNMMQYAAEDQSTSLARQQATAGIAESMGSIYQIMIQMGTTMQQNAASAAQYNITQTGYQAFAKTLQGNPQMQGYYEQLLNLAPGTLSNQQSLTALDTYKQQSLNMTNLLRDTQLYNAGLIQGLPQSDLNPTQGSSGQYGNATSTISQATGIDPNTPLSQVNSSALIPAIIQNEGGSLPGVQNNPGNVKYAGLPGQINSGVKAQDGGTFASYASPQIGQQAILADIKAGVKNNPNQTLGQFIDKYTNTAPKSGMVNPGITTSSPTTPNTGSGSQALVSGSLISATSGPMGNLSSQAITAVTGLTPDEFRYITTGQSALTRMPYGQQQKVKSAVDTFLAKNGVDLSTFQSQYNAQNATLGTNIQRFNNTQIAEGEVTGTLTNLNTAAISAGLGSVNIGNVAKVLTGQQVNDPKASAYAFYFNDLKNSLSYYYAAQQGKASPDIIDNEDAANVIVGGLANGGISGLQDAVTSTTLKMKSVLSNSVDASQKAIWTLFGVGDQYSPPGSKGKLTDKQFVESSLSNQGLSYNSLVAKVPQGMIGVIDNKTGDVSAISPSQFDSSQYTKI